MTANDVMIEYRFSGFRLDVWQRKLFKAGGETVTLSSRAMDALLVLVEHRGETLSKSQLMQAVWPNVVVEENNLNQAISSLRKALGDTKNENNFILTVPLRGYCFVAPVEVLRLPTQGTPAPEAADVPFDTVSKPDEISVIPQVFLSSVAKLPFLRVSALVLLVVAGTALFTFRDSLFSPQGATDSAAQLAAGNAASVTIKNSIAVLPFTNLNPDSDNELFALGLHDEVINQLSKIRSLNVIARNSVLTLMDKQLSIAELGSVLRVESMMSGTILFAGDQARISLQMLDTSTGVTLWSETYEANNQDLAEMMSIQSDIAVNVASALKAEIEQSEQDTISALPTESLEAYRYNLAAKNAYFQQDFAKVWNLSRQAVALDPLYFDALQTFSTVNTVLVATPLQGMTSHEHFELAINSAERMITIAPERTEGYTQKAVALGTTKDWAGVSEVLDKLEAMQAPLSDLKHVALLLLCMGDIDKAIAIYEANLLTEPVNLFGRGFMMAAYELDGDMERVNQEYAIGEELNPIWWGDTVNIFLALGRNEPLQDINELVGISAKLKHLLSNIHDTNLVEASLRAFRATEHKVSAETLYYSAIAAYIGDDTLAVELMRISLADVWTSLFWLWMPVFDETRQLESFRTLLRDSGIVELWEHKGWPKVCQPSGESFVCDWRAYPESATP